MNTAHTPYHPTAKHPHPVALRARDLAERLGVSERHIHRLAKHPDPAVRLPSAFKVGRATFWRFSDIMAWIDRQAENTGA
ncbi:putative prophage CP4-57 regulatory protein [Octadecabacter antarcticus 307]|uniref:Putative prophage CP4-57 regulatory protein n=1 Tax=Octadecabacter antarcticus 307 TaxID=391626 RepID=M9R153_9RHOB|nr:helix-turn-helix domain-containing protein [Octadecabacter antarcticus]AGI65952.1 putative prophage CP4-57 regulatory protein [Octadecabacter antarcticus 307]